MRQQDEKQGRESPGGPGIRHPAATTAHVSADTLPRRSPDAVPRRLMPRRRPRQDRAQATVDAILAAAVDLLASRGHTRTSTNQIARRAGVSIGSLYQYFPNKDAIVLALFERHIEEIEPVIEASLAELRDPGIALRDALRHMLLSLLALHDAAPQTARAMDLLATGPLPGVEVVRRREDRFRRDLAEALAGRADVRPGDLSITASLLFELVESASRWLIHGDGLRFDREAAMAEAVEAVCRSVQA
jgi:AcrR family transcriptional regulator